MPHLTFVRLYGLKVTVASSGVCSYERVIEWAKVEGVKCRAGSVLGLGGTGTAF